MLDFLLKNIDLSILLGLLLLAGMLFITIKHEYIHQKIQGWIYIIIAFILAFSSQYLLLVFVGLIGLLAVLEWKKLLSFGLVKNIIYSIFFLVLLVGFLTYIYFNLPKFFHIFVFISFSDIVAYTVGKNLPWMRGFTSLSPNKTLSGVLGQVFFLAICLYFFMNFGVITSILFGILAPIGDLTESFFKRKAGIKDTADYIPGHGGVLDRVDSSFISINLLLIFTLI